MRAEPVKMQTGPGWHIDLIPEDDSEREILLGMFDEFFEGKRKPWIASIDYTDNKLKSMTLRMVRRSKFRKTVRTELKRLNELHESVGESLGLLFARVKALEDLTKIGALDWMQNASTVPPKNFTISGCVNTPTEHKCSSMPFKNAIKRHIVTLGNGNVEIWWRLHFPECYDTPLQPRILFCPYCGTKLP